VSPAGAASALGGAPPEAAVLDVLEDGGLR
jgi:hypothetical protein